MRTIKLSQEQINTITEALGAAEGAYIDTHKHIINTLVRNRGNVAHKEQEQIANYYHVKACTFADLNNDLTQLKFDI
jgi:hypothetical protein